MANATKILVWVAVLSFIFPAAGFSDGRSGVRVVDQNTGQVVEDAVAVLDGKILSIDNQGLFPITTSGGKLGVKAPGYQRCENILPELPPESVLEVKLAPLEPKALYLSFYGVGSKALRGPALKLIEETELNSLVIDVKGDRGMIPYRSTVALAAEVGAQRIITVRDVDEILRIFKEKNIYTIARIVVFKDDLLATARPDLAVKTPAGELWRDREHLAWVDPFRKEVWDYNIQIAEEAAKLGFDEIQFDYVRFPDSRSPLFSQPNTEDSRVRAITGFLQEAKVRLAPYNVFLAADIFGYVCWNLNDTDIGQKLEPIASMVDYLSPMLYPSGFQFGIPGYRNPVQTPHEIVYLSLKRPRNGQKFPRCGSAPGCRHSRTTPSTAGRSTARNFASRSAPPTGSAPTGGCSGTRATSIQSWPMFLRKISGRPASALLLQTRNAFRMILQKMPHDLRTGARENQQVASSYFFDVCLDGRPAVSAGRQCRSSARAALRHSAGC